MNKLLKILAENLKCKKKLGKKNSKPGEKKN